jgi:hypothetical protein
MDFNLFYFNLYFISILQKLLISIQFYNTLKQSCHKIFCPNEWTALYSNLCEEKGVQVIWDKWMIPFIYHCQKPYTHLGEVH